MAFSKTLNFTYENLGREGYLLFTFDQQDISGQQIYKDYYPTAWRISRLQPTGIFRFSITYNQQFLLANSQIRSGFVVTGSAVTPIDFQQSSSLTGDSSQGYNWSTPQDIQAPGNVFEANNGTDQRQGISVCLQKAGSPIPEPLLYFGDVGSGMSVRVNFSNQLRIYAVSNIQQGSAITAEITSPVLWDHPLDEANLPENWIITYNPANGSFEIKQGYD